MPDLDKIAGQCHETPEKFSCDAGKFLRVTRYFSRSFRNYFSAREFHFGGEKFFSAAGSSFLRLEILFCCCNFPE